MHARQVSTADTDVQSDCAQTDAQCPNAENDSVFVS